MAHELEVVNGRASFAFTGEMPWHLLGQRVDGLQTADVMLGLANADYNVFTTPVFVQDERTGEFVEIPNRFATARVNPHDDGLQPFEVFTQRYTVVQNREALELALAVVDATGDDAAIETLGVMNDGARFFASISTDAFVLDPLGAHDEIGRYILVTTSHDGSAPLRISMTDVRAVCSNTVRLAEKEAKASITARHTPNYEARMAEAKRVLGISTQWAESFQAQAQELLAIDIPLRSFNFDRAINRMFPIDKDATDRQKANRDKQIDQLIAVYGNDRSGGKVGYNGWGLLQAYTEILDWHRNRPVSQLAQEAMESDGSTAKKKVAAQAAILSLAG